MTTTKSIPSTSTSSRTASSRRAGVDVASELRRLMPRDRWILDLLHEHQVMTTQQIASLGFTNVHTARNRLMLLYRRTVLARFRDGVRPGSQQWRWTLDLLGATYIADRNGDSPPTPATIRHRINRLATSPRLSHLLAVNGFFVDLAAHARTTPDAELSVWWCEQRCRSITGDLVHPDGHGVWTENDRTTAFWLEVDTGTEPAHKVVVKLDGYTALRRATGLDHAILFHLSTPGAERSLHPRLAGHPGVRSGELLVATTNAAHAGHLADAVWLPATTGPPARVRLADLPHTTNAPSGRRAAGGGW